MLGFYLNYALIIFIANFVLLILNVPLVRLFTKILQVPASILLPGVAMISFVGIYSLSGSHFDLLLMTGFGVLGFILRKLKIPAVPVILGMIIRKFADNFISSKTSIINKITGILFLIVFFSIWIEERDNIFNYLAQAGLVVLTLNIVMMTIAYHVAKAFASGIEQIKCISIECGLQNGTLALVVGLDIATQVSRPRTISRTFQSWMY